MCRNMKALPQGLASSSTDMVRSWLGFRDRLQCLRSSPTDMMHMWRCDLAQLRCSTASARDRAQNAVLDRVTRRTRPLQAKLVEKIDAVYKAKTSIQLVAGDYRQEDGKGCWKRTGTIAVISLVLVEVQNFQFHPASTCEVKSGSS